jgi:uncharacterized phage-associated protein
MKIYMWDGENMGKLIPFRKVDKNMVTIQRTQQLEAVDVAEVFLRFAPMTPKKVQKLTYYAHAWHMALYGDELISDRFQAWVHGPVAPKMYRTFKDYGWQQIDDRVGTDLPERLVDNRNLIQFAEFIYESYGHLSADELEYLTHQEDPWLQSRGNLEDLQPCRNEINNDVIRNYYRQVMENGQVE